MNGCEIYAESVGEAGQNVMYQQLGTYRDRRYRLEIRTDPYQKSNNQGYAKVDLWDGQQWQEGLLIQGAMMASPANLAYLDKSVNRVPHLQEDIARLQNTVRWLVDPPSDF